MQSTSTANPAVNVSVSDHKDAGDTHQAPSLSSGAYVSGHSSAVRQWHSLRNVPNSAPHLLAILPQLPQGARILDVGCSAGSLTIDIAQRTPQAGEVLGVDLPAAVVATGNDTTAATGGGSDLFPKTDEHGAPLPAYLHFQTADVMQGLPFPDGSFDLVHLHQVLQHVADPVAGLREVRRVARPGGGIVALRESASMTWWPALPWIERWQSLYARLAGLRGGTPNPGARVHAWCMEAGWARSELSCSAGTWLFADEAGRQSWASTMAGRAERGGELRKGLLEKGLSTDEELDAFVQQWRDWVLREDAWWLITHGEVICQC